MDENGIPDVPKSNTAVETTNTPNGGPDTNPATKENIETETKETIKEPESPSSPEFKGGTISETTTTKDSPLVPTSLNSETDSDKKEENAEATTEPEESTSSAFSQPENTASTTAETETQESTYDTDEVANEKGTANPDMKAGESLLPQQEDNTTLTIDVVESEEHQESPPQEVSISDTTVEVANEETTANLTNTEAEGNSVYQQEGDTTLTTTAVETVEHQKSPPQEVPISEATVEVANDEGTANITHMEAEGSSVSQQEGDTTLTTTAVETIEHQESPPQEVPIPEATVEVANEEGTVNLTNMEAEGSSLSQQENNNTLTTTAVETQESPPQEESINVNDGNNVVSAGEASSTPEVEHFYLEGNVDDNRRGSTQKNKKRRRYLKIAIGVVLVIIISLGLGIGVFLATKDEGITTPTMTTISTTTTETTTIETATNETSTIEETTTPEPTTTTTVSPSFISNHEMRNFTKGFADLDENNKGSKVTVKHQDKIQDGINQTYNKPLLVFKNHALEGPTFKTFVALLEDYDPRVDIEDIPDETKVKEFLDAVMETSIMQATEEFMISKTFDENLRDYLQKIWFTRYSRSWNGVLGSSGFEHTFVGEQKDGHILGFQNWVNFGLQEESGNLAYKGWKKSVSLKPRTVIPNPIAKNKGEILELNFEWDGNTRSFDYMFIGTSPELEMALYTLCYWAKLGEKCHVQLNNHRFVIHTMDFSGLGVVGSVYPDISNTII